MKRTRRVDLALALAALVVALYALPVLAGIGTVPGRSVALTEAASPGGEIQMAGIGTTPSRTVAGIGTTAGRTAIS